MTTLGIKKWNLAASVFAFLFLFFQSPVNGTQQVEGISITCEPPNDVEISSQTSNSVSFIWDDEGNTTKVWYYRSEDTYTSQSTTTGNNSINYSNLSDGTYTFYFATVCGTTTSQSIVIDDLMMG